MARVQMLLSITGGRADGTEWPPSGGTLVCGEREARELVLGEMARWAPDGEERAVMPPPAAGTAATAPPDEGAGDGPPDAEDGPDGDGRPLVRDPKQTWEEHAVTLGATPEAAAAMTKADLVAKFGNGGPAQ
jgi:hypothetical protein